MGWVFQKIVTIDVHIPGVPNSKDYAGFQAREEQCWTEIDRSYRKDINKLIFFFTKVLSTERFQT